MVNRTARLGLAPVTESRDDTERSPWTTRFEGGAPAGGYLFQGSGLWEPARSQATPRAQAQCSQCGAPAAASANGPATVSRGFFPFALREPRRPSFPSGLEQEQTGKKPKPPRPPRKSSPLEAHKFYLGENRLLVTLGAAFLNNHVVPGHTSSHSAKDAALKRYEREVNGPRPPAMRSSWIGNEKGDQETNRKDVTEMIRNKVLGAKTTPHVFGATQQLCAPISVNLRTVTITRFQNAAQATHRVVAANGTVHHLRLIAGANQKTQINVIGAWNPETGEFTIDHYDAGAAPASTMLAKYIKIAGVVERKQASSSRTGNRPMTATPPRRRPPPAQAARPLRRR